MRNRYYQVLKVEPVIEFDLFSDIKRVKDCFKSSSGQDPKYIYMSLDIYNYLLIQANKMSSNKLVKMVSIMGLTIIIENSSNDIIVSNEPLHIY